MAIFLEIIFIILFAIFVDYGGAGDPKQDQSFFKKEYRESQNNKSSPKPHNPHEKYELVEYYPGKAIIDSIFFSIRKKVRFRTPHNKDE